MSTVLVTGASGFIGQRLVKRLVNKVDRVICMVRKTSKAKPLLALGVECRYGDITRRSTLENALHGVDQVYHLAGTIVANKKDDFRHINADGTENLVRACAAMPKVPTMVFVSSLAAAGPAISEQPRVETDPSAPVSKYGKSKLDAEERLTRYADEVPISIARPPIVYGPCDMQLLKAFRSIARGIHVSPTRKPHRVSTIHVDDLADSLMVIADRGQRISTSDAHSQGTYFIACDDFVTYSDLGRAIARAMDRKVFVWEFRPHAIWTIAAMSELGAKITGKASIMNFDKMREATAGSWICSADRLASELNFVPRYSLEEGLRQTAQWYRENGFLPKVKSAREKSRSVSIGTKTSKQV